MSARLGDYVRVPLSCGLSRGADEEPDSGPGHAGIPSDPNRLDHVALGVRAFLHRAAQ